MCHSDSDHLEMLKIDDEIATGFDDTTLQQPRTPFKMETLSYIFTVKHTHTTQNCDV